jgi:chlorite dismutase
MADMPEVPLTMEGSYVLHQMFRFSRSAWRQQEAFHCDRILQHAAETLGVMEAAGKGGSSAVYSMIGHKGDLMFVHFRDSLEDVHRAELSVGQMELTDFLEPTHSFLSVVELGLYESTAKTYAELTAKGIVPHTPQWETGVTEVLARQAAAMAPRLHPEIPASKYICFYPMDRRRGEAKNWYQVPLPERQRMMHEHGMIGRRYADSVKQIISGSIGFDDSEWGVDLFADDPLVFKKLIYEMRFDEVSAVYALFGAFYVGLRIRAKNLRQILAGELT